MSGKELSTSAFAGNEGRHSVAQRMSLPGSSVGHQQPVTLAFLGNVKKLGETYPKISNAQNAELRLRWGQIILKNDYQEEFWKVKDFLQSQVGNYIPGPLTGCGALLSYLRSSFGRATGEPHRSALQRKWG